MCNRLVCKAAGLLILLVSQQHVGPLPPQRDPSEVGQRGSVGRSLILWFITLRGIGSFGAGEEMPDWCEGFGSRFLIAPPAVYLVSVFVADVFDGLPCCRRLEDP